MLYVVIFWNIFFYYLLLRNGEVIYFNDVGFFLFINVLCEVCLKLVIFFGRKSNYWFLLF